MVDLKIALSKRATLRVRPSKPQSLYLYLESHPMNLFYIFVMSDCLSFVLFQLFIVNFPCVNKFLYRILNLEIDVSSTLVEGKKGGFE